MDPPDPEPIEQMHRAVRRGILEEVQGLVQQDRRLVSTASRYGFLPLVQAAEGGHLSVVRYLLDEGADIHQTDHQGRRALQQACYRGGPLVVALLLERGADPAARGAWGTTPLIRASSSRHVDVVKLLLAHGCGDINHRDDVGRTACYVACRWGRLDMVQVLLEAGADRTLVDKEGRTPRDIAARCSKHNVVRLLEVCLPVEVSCAYM